MNKDSKIYVAGHYGLVGSAITRRLVEAGYNNLILLSSSELDLRDKSAVDAFFEKEKPEFVFLAAAKVGGIMANKLYRADFIYENLAIQNNVIHACYEFKVKKLLFLGSSCIYPKEAPQPITEDSLLTSPLEWTNEPYAIAKIAGIKMIESYNLQYGTNYLSVMPTNLYGPNDNYDFEKAHVFPALIRKMILARWFEQNNLEAMCNDLNVEADEIIGKLESLGIIKKNNTVALTVWGTGEPRREFLHVDDMANACIFVMEKVNFENVSGDAIEVRNTHLNVGTNTDISIKDFALLVAQKVGFEGTLTFDTTKPDGTMRKLMSSKKLNELGWQAQISLEEGVTETITSYLGRSNA